MLNTQEKPKKKFIYSSISCSNGSSPLDETFGFKVAWSINPHMKVGASQFSVAAQEHKRFISALEFSGAEVFEVPFLRGAYDSVFMKDNAIVVEDRHGVRAMLANLKTEERRIEALQRKKALERLGVQVQAQASYHLEGGDFVNTCHDMAFLGYGFRSDQRMARELSNFVRKEVLALELIDPHFYHLDTAMNVTQTDEGCVVFAYRHAFSHESWQRLQDERKLKLIEISREEAMKFGANWVESNNTVILGSHVPQIEAELRRLGKNVIVTPLSQFQLAGGSAACLVAPVHEGATSPRPRVHAMKPGAPRVLFEEMGGTLQL